MQTKILLKNCQIYINRAGARPVDIFIEDDRIVKISQKISHSGASIINAEERLVTPGLIDIHIQGAGGSDVMDSEEALRNIARTLAKCGVTGYLATTVVRPEIENKHLKVIAENVGKDLGGARILGIHLEGPFINPQKRGGISVAALCPSSLSELQKIIDICGGTLRMMTIAPELPGNLDLIETLVRNDIVASFGHSAADYKQTMAGFSAGISHVTHIFNAMHPIHHREPGPVTAIFESEDITAQIISDGVHLHPAIVNLIYSNIGIKRCVCITDGVQAIGLPEGRYIYNGREYESRDGVARYDDGTLIGTAIGINEIARRFRTFTGCTVTETIETVTLNPARVIHLDNHIGNLLAGHDADLTIFDKDESVYMTIVKGNIVYQKEA